MRKLILLFFILLVPVMVRAQSTITVPISIELVDALANDKGSLARVPGWWCYLQQSNHPAVYAMLVDTTYIRGLTRGQDIRFIFEVVTKTPLTQGQWAVGLQCSEHGIRWYNNRIMHGKYNLIAHDDVYVENRGFIDSVWITLPKAGDIDVGNWYSLWFLRHDLP